MPYFARMLLVAFLTTRIVSLAVADDANDAVPRALAYLSRDAVAWRQDYQCASCHHAGLATWALHEAKAAGYQVDQPALDELTRWLAASGDGSNLMTKRTEAAPRAINLAGLCFALALKQSERPEAHAALAKLRQTLANDQLPDGSWQAWPQTRPPIFAGETTLTALSMLALQGAPADDEASRAARKRAEAWLASHGDDVDQQSLATRLMALAGDAATGQAQPLAPLAARLIEHQRADGGWAQTADMSSDAYATGQVLYALALAGYTSEHKAVRQARQFLAATQDQDGSWPMTSRPIEPGGEGSSSLRPIRYAGSAWATLGLVRSK